MRKSPAPLCRHYPNQLKLLIERDHVRRIKERWTKGNVPVIKEDILRFVGEDGPGFRALTVLKPKTILVAINPKVCISIRRFTLEQAFMPCNSVCSAPAQRCIRY